MDRAAAGAEAIAAGGDKAHIEGRVESLNVSQLATLLGAEMPFERPHECAMEIKKIGPKRILGGRVCLPPPSPMCLPPPRRRCPTKNIEQGDTCRDTAYRSN